MSDMFSGATAFRGLGLDIWDVNRDLNMEGMFRGAEQVDEDLGSLWRGACCESRREDRRVRELMADCLENGPGLGPGLGP